MAGTIKSLLAFDIDQTRARWALLERPGGVWKIAKSESVELPVGDASESRRRDALTALIRKAVGQAGRPAPPIFTALPKGAVFVRIVDAPNIPRKELAQVMGLRAMKEIPRFSEAEVEWDFELLPGLAEDPVRQAAMIAVRRETLTRFLEPFTAAGIKPKIVDAESLALLRWFLNLRRAQTSSSVAILDFGETGVSISIVERGRAARLTQAPIAAGAIRAADGDAIKRFVMELKGAMETLEPGVDVRIPITEIYFAGDPTLFKPVEMALRHAMNAGVAPLEQALQLPAGWPAFDKSPFQGDNAIVAALLHRTEVRGAPLGNLAPVRKAPSNFKKHFERLTSLPVLGLAAVAAAALFYFGNRSIRAERLELLDKGVQEIQPLRSTLVHAQDTEKVFTALEKDQFSWLVVLKELDDILPDDASLTLLKMERAGKGSLAGEIGGRAPLQTADSIGVKMEESSVFSEVGLGPIRPRAQGSAVFSMTFKIDKKGGK